MKTKIRKEVRGVMVNGNIPTDVLLTITVGNGDKGGNHLIFEDAPNTTIAKGDIKNFNVGKSTDLLGKTLVITTNILDTNDQTNKVIATYNFKSCEPVKTLIDDTVDNDGDIFSLEIKFTFKKM